MRHLLIDILYLKSSKMRNGLKHCHAFRILRPFKSRIDIFSYAAVRTVHTLHVYLNRFVYVHVRRYADSSAQYAAYTVTQVMS